MPDRAVDDHSRRERLQQMRDRVDERFDAVEDRFDAVGDRIEDRFDAVEEAVEQRVRPIIASLRERRARHKERNIVVRGLYLVAALTVLLAGLLMLVLPGPALVVIPVGLTLLALEFASAEKLLERALDQADAAKAKAAETTNTQRILLASATGLAIAAAVTAVLVMDINIPYLPI